MISYRRLTVLALVMATVTASSSCGGGPGSATGAPAATAPATQSTPASDPRLPEGTYRTPVLTFERIAAAGVAAGFKHSEVEAYYEVDEGQSTSGTWIYTIKLSAGRWTEFAVFNNGPNEIGWAGRYQVVDDRTIVATDGCWTITYRFKLDGDKLTLDMVDDKCQGQDGAVEQGELIAQTTIYESAPFTKVG
jgi:hypothetical protein